MLRNNHRIKILKNLISSGFKGSYLNELKRYDEGGFFPEIPNKFNVAPSESTAIKFPTRDLNFNNVDISYMPDPITYSRENDLLSNVESFKQNPEFINRQIELNNKVDIESKPKEKILDLNNVAKSQSYLQSKGYDIGKAGVDNKLGLDTVKAIQQYLKNNGYYIGQDRFANRGIDGKLGAVTMKAIEEFNQDQLLGKKSIYNSKYTTEEGFLGNCDEKQCTEFSQKELIKNTTLTESDLVNKVGFTGNAWNVEKNLLAKGGEQIYSDKKKINKVDNIQRGDHISIYTGGLSDFQEQAGKGNPTHSGIVDSRIIYDPNGRPFVYVIHNVHKSTLGGDYQGRMFRNKMYLDDLKITGFNSFQVVSIVSPNLSGTKEKEVSKPDLDLQIVIEEDNNPHRLKAIEGLNDGEFRTKSMFDFGLNDTEYMSLATAVLGLLDQESGFGEVGKIPMVGNRAELLGKELIATTVRGIQGGEASLGWARIKYNTNFKNIERRLNTDYGLTKSKLSVARDMGDNSAKAALLIVAKYYNELKQKNNVDSKEEALYLALQKFNRYSLGSTYGSEQRSSYDYAKDRDLSYVNKILNNSLKYKVVDNEGTTYKTLTDSLNKDEIIALKQFGVLK